MTGTDGRVDPPPLSVPVVDANGFPTMEMRNFMHRLWERTGGNDSGDDFLLKLMQTSARPHVQQKIEESADQWQPEIIPPSGQIGALFEQLQSVRTLALRLGNTAKPEELIDQINGLAIIALSQALAADAKYQQLKERIEALEGMYFGAP